MTSPTGPGGQEARTLCGFCGYADAQPFTFCPRCGRPASTFSGQVTLNEQTRPSAPLGPMGQTFGSAPTQAGIGPYGAQPPMPGTGPYGPQAPYPYPTVPAGGPPFGAPSGPAGVPPAGYMGAPTWQSGPAGAPPAGFIGAPTWQNSPAGPGIGYPQGGLYSPAMGGQAAAPTKPPWSRKRRVSVMAAALLALLIVGSASAYFVYTAFFAYSPVDSARYLPANTLVYTSFDLQQVAQNSHNLSQKDVAGTTNTSGFEQATGLDFEKDVAPWVKRSFSFALVDVSSQATPDGYGTQTTAGTVFLISTHDTNASNAAIQKIIANQEQKYGVKFTAISYGGVTLQSDVDSVQSQQANGSFGSAVPSPLVLGIVKDQVIIASTVAVAEQVVDRANGTGDTLEKNTTFTDAMTKLPGDRFGTLYVNVQQLLHELMAGSNGANQTGIDGYPVAYGALEFTNVGMRLTFTLEAKAGTHSKYQLSGDTNASAGVVPSNALLFAGLGNLSGFYHQISGALGGGSDQSFQQALGLSPDDPLFQAPVSVALLPPKAGSDDVVDPLVMLHSNLDAATTNAKVQQALQTLGATTSTSTLNGVTVTAVQAPQTTQTVYYALLGKDLVFAYDSYGMGQAIDTFQGRTDSLASLATFKELVAQAPKNNALTLFVSLDNLAHASGQLGDAYRQMVQQDSLLAKTTADYLTYNSDDSGITITDEIALR